MGQYTYTGETIYRRISGASPKPLPVGITAEKGVRSARAAGDDSQRVWKGRELSRERREVEAVRLLRFEGIN